MKRDKPKLAILTISFAAGGAERVISLLLKKLIHDFDVTLVLFFDEIAYAIPKEVNLIVLKENVKPNRSLIQKMFDSYTLVSGYNKIIKSKNIDISMSFLGQPNLFNGIAAMRNKKIKTIISERCFPSIIYNYNALIMPIIKILFPLLYNKNDILFSNSKFINEDLKDNYGVKIPMKVIYNPIEIDSSLQIDAEAIENGKSFKLINVGSMEPRKNQALLLEALNNLNDVSLSMTIIGDGPLRGKLLQDTKQKNLDNSITYTGKVSNVKDYLIKSDCFVLSSNTEGFPNVLLEALSVGLPSIATNCLSGPSELLHDSPDINIPKGEFFEGKYGILINTEDHMALEKAITYLREHPEIRKKYSISGLERAKEYELPIIYEQMKDLILE